MKKIFLSILSLAAVIGLIPTFTYSAEVTKDGITIRVSNEYNRSEILKEYGLTCLYVRIKNDTGVLIEVPKYAVSDSLVATEKILIGTINDLEYYKKINIAKSFVTSACFTGFITSALLIESWMVLQKKVFICGIASLLVGSASALPLYINMSFHHLYRSSTKSMLQEYLDLKPKTIHVGGEYGFYFYIDLGQYKHSIGKNITVRLRKKDTNQVLSYVVDTTGILQNQTQSV